MASRLLAESKVEYENVTRQLRDKLTELKCRPVRDFRGQTRESCAGLESHMHLVSSLYESYSDILPTLEKSLADVKVEQEFSFDPSTMVQIYQESSPSPPPEDSAEPSSRMGSGRDSGVSTPLMEVPSKQSFTWDILRKLTGGKPDTKATQARSSNGKMSLGKSAELNASTESVQQEREWDSEVFRVMQSGVPAKALETRISNLIASGNGVPGKKRGLLWRSLIGNRGRINRRLFRLLLGLLDKASTQVRESIVKDMDRTYSDFKVSPTYCQVKSEAVKVLQLFDVGWRDADTSAGHRLHPGHELPGGRVASQHEHLPRFQVLLQPGVPERHLVCQLLLRHAAGRSAANSRSTTSTPSSTTWSCATSPRSSRS